MTTTMNQEQLEQFDEWFKKNLFHRFQDMEPYEIAKEAYVLGRQLVQAGFGHKCFSCGHRFEDPINVEVDISTTVASCPECRSPRIDIDAPPFSPSEAVQAKTYEDGLRRAVEICNNLALGRDATGWDELSILLKQGWEAGRDDCAEAIEQEAKK